MRLLALPLIASMLLTRDGAREPAARLVASPELPPVTEVAEPAPLEAIAPVPVPASVIHETSAPVPGDVTVDVLRGSGGAWSVRLARKGHLVALRHGGARTAAADQATLALVPGDPEPLVWEASRFDTLATTRGTLRLDGAATPHALVRLAEAPVPAGRDERQRHVCEAHEDGAGGFAVLCRVQGIPSAANVTGDDAKADVWVAADRMAPVVRLDLPASPAGVEARMMGYAAGGEGVVVRAEASRVAGEERPVLTLLSADRIQPQVPRRSVRTYRCCGGL
jgi:hypothetical protein